MIGRHYGSGAAEEVNLTNVSLAGRQSGGKIISNNYLIIA